MKQSTLLGLLLGLVSQEANGYLLPGDNPQSFAAGEEVKLKVNKMTSSKTLMPVDYYRLPFCQPDGGPKMDNENLGEFLAGDRIESSPYRLQMKTEMYCEQVCISNLGRGESSGVSPNAVVRAIRKKYYNNWILDNLPSAYKREDDESVTIRYWQGFPIGFVDDVTKKAYINNHVNIEIMYHPVETESEKFRVIRFTVEPFSIKHEYEPVDENDDAVNTNNGAVIKVAKLIKPIPSCDETRKTKQHTDYKMVTEAKRRHTDFYMGNEAGAQEASGQVLFTYDVTWVENTDTKWASRWDIYLSSDNAITAEVHWLTITNSLVIIILLSAMIALMFARNIRPDLEGYHRLPLDENTEDVKRVGWTALHADIFRPPSFSPLLLSCACGTGAQILATSLLTLIFSAMRYLSSANRGALLMAELVLYAAMGGIGGYVTARFYKTFKGESPQQATICTALGFPGIAFFLFILLDLLALSQGSSYAVPFTTMIVLLVLWFGILTPLVFFGASIGYKEDAMEFPVNTSSFPRQIPDQPWFMGIPFTLAIGGILPFGMCIVELRFILASVWMGQYYYIFGFLLLVFFILIITCAEITILLCYDQLCRENYHWWWRSFCTSGSIALYVFFYSFQYFKQLEVNSFAMHMLYFGYMGVVSLGLFMMTGSVGVMSSLWFNQTIFSALKVDSE